MKTKIVEIELCELTECYDADCPLDSPVYKTQCATFALARKMTGNPSFVTSTGVISDQTAPYCLRIKRQYRNLATQTFRNKVAAMMRDIRRAA